MKLNDLFFFVNVVDRQGFGAAAKALNVPKSSISKRIAELEKDLGVRLIQRTTRRFAVTDAGKDFYRHAAAALVEAEAAEDAVKRRLSEPRGLVRITAATATVQMALADLLPELTRQYPKLQIGLVVTSRYTDLVQEGIDIAIRAHRHPLPDSDYVQRRLGYSPNYLVAAPEYLAANGSLSRPDELAEHCGIVPESSPDSLTWSLRSASGGVVAVEPRPKLFTDDPYLIVNAALAGTAIANLPHGLAWPHIESGRLVRVLPEWDAGGATTTLLMPHRRGQLPSVRAVVESLAIGMAQKMGLQ